MIDQYTETLLQQQRSLATSRWRWPWQDDPNNYLSDIDSYVHVLCSGNALAATNLTDAIYNAHLGLTSNNDVGFGGATRDLQDWTGSAADNFSRYLLQVQQAMQRYDDILHDFRQIQAGYASLVSGCVTDVQNLLNKAIEAQQETSQDTWEVVLTAIAGVSAGIGAIVSGPVGWAIVTSSVALAASEGSVLISTDGPGETAKSLRDGLAGLLNDVINQRENFYYAIEQLDDVVMDNVDNPNVAQVRPQPPTIITAPSFDPATFDLPSNIEPPGIENGVSRAPLVPSTQQPNTQISAKLVGH